MAITAWACNAWRCLQGHSAYLVGRGAGAGGLLLDSSQVPARLTHRCCSRAATVGLTLGEMQFCCQRAITPPGCSIAGGRACCQQAPASAACRSASACLYVLSPTCLFILFPTPVLLGKQVHRQAGMLGKHAWAGNADADRKETEETKRRLSARQGFPVGLNDAWMPWRQQPPVPLQAPALGVQRAPALHTAVSCRITATLHVVPLHRPWVAPQPGRRTRVEQSGSRAVSRLAAVGAGAEGGRAGE